MTQFYVGVKQVEAWPQEKDGRPGYAVKYEGNYISWSPADVFERAYLPMGILTEARPEDAPGVQAGFVPNRDRVTQRMVDGFIRSVQAETRGKTTIVHVTLANGFELVESSSCVNAANYDEDLGKEICLERINDRIWFLLGFLLQTARQGVGS